MLSVVVSSGPGDGETSVEVLGATGRGMKGIKGLKQTREFALGVTKVLKTVLAGGEDSYEFGSSGVKVRGYWTEDGVVRLDITGLTRRGSTNED